MRKHGGPPSRRDKHVTLAAISPPGVARGRFVGGQQSGLAGCKPPPLFTRGASSCSSQGRRQGEPWGASPRPSAPTYLPFVLPLSTSFRLALAGVVAFAFASAFARAFARILNLQLRRQALLMVALILVELPLPTEGTGDSTPVVIRQLRLGAVFFFFCFPWTTKQSRCSQSGACCRWPCSSMASHQKSSLTFSMVRACLGVVPCPGLDPWYPLAWLLEPPPPGR